MTIKKTKKDKYLIIDIQSESLTAKDTPDLKSELVLECKKDQNIILDMNNLKYIDSAGLSCLLISDRLTKDNKNISVVCNANEKILKLINLTKLNTILTVVNTLEEAEDFVKFNELEKEI